jgi:subtilisin family serine protease
MTYLLKSCVAFTVATLVFAGCSGTSTDSIGPETSNLTSEHGQIIPGQYIVVLSQEPAQRLHEGLQRFNVDEEHRAVRSQTERFMTDAGVRSSNIHRTFASAIRGAVVTLTDEQAARLRATSGIAYVEPDRVLRVPVVTVTDIQARKSKPISGGGSTDTSTSTQKTPWGVTRVGGFADASSSSVTAWIIDTGIDLDHPDLNVDLTRCKTFAYGTTNADDMHGHGTHVAGIVGAKNNTIGSVGVAAGIKLVSLRMYDDAGSGSVSNAIAAFDHVAANGLAGDVVNYSSGPSSRWTSQTFDDCVKNVGAKGIKVTLAAGNQADDCAFYSPARTAATNVFTISNMTSSGALSTSSNFGTPVDYAEPGSSIYSTYKGGGYATMSGTSMAAPHAAGILALGAIRNGGTITGDKDATPDVIGVR